MGNIANPLGFTPPEFCSWEHRFDDAARRFRTLYCAEEPLTCLRETLADLRPSPKVLKDLGQRMLTPVPGAWRRTHALAPAHLQVLSGGLVDLDEVAIRRDLALELVDLIEELGFKHLDMGEIQGSERRLTQAVASVLYRWGAAGVVYRSKLDNKVCAALFEGRAELLPAGEIQKLTDPLSDLEKVCREFHLDLR